MGRTGILRNNQLIFYSVDKKLWRSTGKCIQSFPLPVDYKGHPTLQRSGGGTLYENTKLIKSSVSQTPTFVENWWDGKILDTSTYIRSLIKFFKVLIIVFQVLHKKCKEVHLGNEVTITKKKKLSSFSMTHTILTWSMHQNEEVNFLRKVCGKSI